MPGPLTAQSLNVILGGTPATNNNYGVVMCDGVTLVCPSGILSVTILNQNTTGTARNVTGVVGILNGGTGLPNPSLIAGTNVTITGAWPNQTITSGASMTWPASPGIVVYGGSGAWGTSLTAPAGAIVGTTDTQALTNKTLDGVSPATMAFVDPSSSIQTQINGKQASGAYLTGNQTITLSGDTTGSGATAITTTTGALNGTTVPVNSAADQTIVTTGSAVGAWKGLPGCLDSSGNHLNYDTSTHAFSCGTTSSTGAPAFSALTGSTNTTSAMVVGAGASLAPTSATAGVLSANQLNGTSLAGLATGIVKNTTTTGVPSIAVAGDFPTLNQSTTGNALTATTTTNIAGGLLGTIPYQSAVNTTALLAGNTAANDQVLISHGTGTVSAIPSFTTAPTISAANMTSFPASLMTTSTVLGSSQMPVFTGDVTASGLALTVGKIGGKTVSLSGNFTTTGAFDPTLSIPSSSTWTFPAGPSTLMSTATVLASGQMPTLTGDVTNSGLSMTAAKINGTSVPTNATADQVILTTASATGSWGAVPACLDSAGNHLNYSTGSHAFSCGTSSSGGNTTFSDLTGSTNTTAAMVVGSGATLAPTSASAGVISANQINGTALGSLGTGILKNTTTTGVPSIAVAGDFPTLNQSTTGTANLAGGVMGSLPYQSAAATTAVIAGNTAATDQVLISHGTGSVSAIPTLGNAPALSAANMTSFPASLMTTSTVLAASQEPVHTGDMTNLVGNLATTVGAIGGKTVSLSGNFTTTGAFNPTFSIPSSSTWTFPAGPSTLMSTATVLGSAQVPTFTGDVTASGLALTVGAIGGKTVSLSGNLATTGAFNPTFSIPSSSTWTFPAGPSTLMSTTTVLASAQMPTFTGDVTNSNLAMTAVKINGTTVPTNAAADQVILTTGSAVGSWAAVTPCLDSGGNHLNYNSSTHAFLCGTTDIATTWGGITNPIGNLVLTMGTKTTTYNYATALANAWTWANNTAAVVGTSQSSPPLALCGTGFHASASVTDCLTLQVVPGAGNDAAITFAVGHTGSSTGLVTTTFPGPVQAATNGGVGGSVTLPEGTTETAISANDICYGDSTLHGIKCSNNNGSFLNLPLETGTMTSGDLVSVNATTNLIADSGVVAANAVTAAGTLTSNAVLLGGGTKTSSAISVDSTTTHALFATAGAPAFRAMATSDLPAALAYGSVTTASNCVSSASPAACSAAPAGSVTIAAAATTKVVNTSAVTANSQILVVFDSSLGTRLSVTCNTTVAVPTVSARSAGVSFTLSTASAPSTNPACYSYSIVN